MLWQLVIGDAQPELPVESEKNTTPVVSFRSFPLTEAIRLSTRPVWRCDQKYALGARGDPGPIR